MRYLFEDYALDTDRRELTRGEAVIGVAPQAFDLLVFLIRHRERFVSKDELIEAVWDGHIITDAALTTRLYVARRAVGDTGGGQRLIKTLPRKGFRFVGAVREESGPPRPPAAGISLESAGAALYVADPPANAVLPPPERPSIAVLPFTNMSDERELAFFADGIVEDLLTELSSQRWLLVSARNSSSVYRDMPIDTRQVGAELGVRYVLGGSVRRVERRVRVTAQLIDATTGTHLSAERFERNLGDTFSAQDEITEAIASAVASAIVHAEQRRAALKLPQDRGAWELYQLGMWHMSKCDASENAIACTFFQHAIALDAGYAAAYGALAWSHMMAASIFSEMTIAEGCDLSEPLVGKAIALDDEDTEVRARLALTTLLKGELEEALQDAEQVLSVNPNCAGALGVKGAAQVYSGHREDGRQSLRRFLQLSPRDPARPIRLSQVATSHYLDGNYEDAASTARQVVRQYPKHPIAYRWLAASLGQLNRVQEARDALRTLQTIAPSSFEMYVRQRPKYCIVEYAPMLAGLRKAGWKE